MTFNSLRPHPAVLEFLSGSCWTPTPERTWRYNTSWLETRRSHHGVTGADDVRVRRLERELLCRGRV